MPNSGWAALLAALLTAAPAAEAASLRWESVYLPKVATVRIDKQCFLMVEGMASNSADVVQRLVLSEEHGTAQVDVTTGLFGSGDPGSFRIAVSLELPSIRRVTFGPSHTEIWHAEGAPCPPPPGPERKSADDRPE